MRVSFVVMVTCAVLIGCSTAPPQSDLTSEEQAIRKMDARWLKAANDRDAAAQAAMYAPDGVSYHDGEEPAAGPPAIQAWEAASAAKNPKAVLTSTTESIRIATAGDMAVQTGVGSISKLGPNGEDAAVHRWHFVTVWRKADGEWKVAQDIASSVP